MAKKVRRDNKRLGINEIARAQYLINKKNGFHDHKKISPDTAVAWFGLVMTELAEAVEWVRKKDFDAKREYVKIPGLCRIFDHPNYFEIVPAGTNYRETLESKPEGFPSELADIILRTADIAEAFGVDLERAIRKKLSYNSTRPHMHGKWI